VSTIVAVIKNNVACIAADSLTSFGDSKQPADYVTDSDKIMCFPGLVSDTYMGIVGSAAHQLVMQNLAINHIEAGATFDSESSLPMTSYSMQVKG